MTLALSIVQAGGELELTQGVHLKLLAEVRPVLLNSIRPHPSYIQLCLTDHADKRKF